MKQINDQAHTATLQFVREIATQLRDLQSRAVLDYTPIVNDLIESKCRDTNKIEFTLDYILDFAGSGEGLALFQRLLEYLKSIDPQGAKVYQRYWNEQWHDEMPPK